MGEGARGCDMLRYVYPALLYGKGGGMSCGGCVHSLILRCPKGGRRMEAKILHSVVEDPGFGTLS